MLEGKFLILFEYLEFGKIPWKYGWSLFQIPTEPDLNFCPRPNSTSKSGIASTNIMTRNGMIKEPPPYFWTRYGNLHTLPKPTPKAKQA